MRELTEAEKSVLEAINVNHIDYDNIEGFIKAGFIAGLEYQDSRIAELEYQLAEAKRAIFILEQLPLGITK